MPEIELKPVKWKEGQYSTSRAFIGPVEVGGVSYTMKRDDPNKWYVRMFVGATGQGFATKEGAMAYVEGSVLAFVRSIAKAVKCVPPVPPGR